MFGPDVVVAHLTGLFNSVFEHQLRIGGEFDPATCVVTLAADTLDHLAHSVRFQAQFAQNATGHTTIFLQ